MYELSKRSSFFELVKGDYICNDTNLCLFYIYRNSLIPSTTISSLAWSERNNSNRKGSFFTAPTDNVLSPTQIPTGFQRRASRQFSSRAGVRPKTPVTPKKKKKDRREAMRPFSPMYTNLNSCQVENR